jgi:hypothetical protein
VPPCAGAGILAARGSLVTGQFSELGAKR